MLIGVECEVNVVGIILVWIGGLSILFEGWCKGEIEINFFLDDKFLYIVMFVNVYLYWDWFFDGYL